MTSVPSDGDPMLVSPDDVSLVEPPVTYLRSHSVTAPSSTASSMTMSAQQPEVGISDVLFNRDSTSRRQCSGVSLDCGHADMYERSDYGRRDTLSSDNVDEPKKHLEQRNVVRRLMLLVSDAADGRDDRVTVSLFLVITLFFL